jgi:hypothetical protein
MHGHARFSIFFDARTHVFDGRLLVTVLREGVPGSQQTDDSDGTDDET